MKKLLEYIEIIKAVFDKNFVSLSDVLSQDEINTIINGDANNQDNNAIDNYTWVYGNNYIEIVPPADVNSVQIYMTKENDQDLWWKTTNIAVTPLEVNKIDLSDYFTSGANWVEKIIMEGYIDTIVSSNWTMSNPNPQPFVKVQ